MTNSIGEIYQFVECQHTSLNEVLENTTDSQLSVTLETKANWELSRNKYHALSAPWHG